MPRFAVLSHDHPFPHWDLLLEDEVTGACRTWRLMSALDTSGEIEAEQTFDHRLMYLDYEGPISGDRGTVTGWDRGEFEWRAQWEDLCEVTLTGSRWQGTIRLSRCDKSRWTCVRIA